MLAAPFRLPEYLASCRLQEEVRLKAVSQWSLDRISGKITSILAIRSLWKAGACCSWSELDEYPGLSVTTQSGSSPS